MAKKSIVTTEDTGTTSVPDITQLVAESAFFEPTDEQRRVKIKFFARISDNPTVEAKSATLAQVKQITQSAAVEKWWPVLGFREWFLNSSEHMEQLEFLFDLSIRALTNILQNEDPKAQGARVQAIKHLAEIAGKMPKKQASMGQFLDKAIAGMDEYQLAAYLEKNGVSLSLGASKKQLPTPAPVKILDIEEK